MPRPMRAEEIAIVKALVGVTHNAASLVSELHSVLVSDMPDGGMGGIVFENSTNEKRRFAEDVAQAEFDDADGVNVFVSVYLDNDGLLFELDFWKTDFSPLLRYPTPGDLRPPNIVSAEELMARKQR